MIYNTLGKLPVETGMTAPSAALILIFIHKIVKIYFKVTVFSYYKQYINKVNG